jgi:hypothetical protein
MSAGEDFPFEKLDTADLHVDAVYRGRRSANAGDDPLHRLLGVSLMGGFRYLGTLDLPKLVVLTTSLRDPDWPDAVDRESGTFTYYGDNKKPGRALHDTPRFGNEILRHLFAMAQGGSAERRTVPPILVFASAGTYRDMIFVGLAVPGTTDIRAAEDLVAVWKVDHNKRFQNYRARFTILDVPVVTRAWLTGLTDGTGGTSELAPAAWRSWIDSGERKALVSAKSIEYRRKLEQVPESDAGRSIIRAIHLWFTDRPHDFEKCAAAIARMMLPDIATMDMTRPSRDGGRDAIGQLRIGSGPASILVDFALEAKCYAIESAVGVREISRLISRLRHRQFGILVTTSYLEAQAYKEIKHDRHPIVVISARDIVSLLATNGLGDQLAVDAWLREDFPAEVARTPAVPDGNGAT